MPVDSEGKWVGNTTQLVLNLSEIELERWEIVKGFVLANGKDFNKKQVLIKTFEMINNIDPENMNIIEAIIYNYITGKSFVKNSWSNESKEDLQMFYENNRKFTQKKDKIDSNTSQITLDSTKYSVYRGFWKSKQNLEKSKLERFKELELKIGSLYNEFKEYEDLKMELKEK